MSIRNITPLLLRSVFQEQPLNVSVRFYGRWMHRTPSKVILPFEPASKVHLKEEKVIDLNVDSIKNSQKKLKSQDRVKISEDVNPQVQSTLPSEKSKSIKKKKDEKLHRRQFYLSQEKVFDDNNEIIFEKLKENDSRVSTLLTNLKSKKERLRSRQVMVEGWRLIVDGLEANCNLKYVIFSRADDLNNLRPFLPKTGVKFYKIPYKEIELWSNVETSPGIFGVFEMPTQENVKRLSKPLPLQFICDNIRVPGNLGAILRAAVGAGCEKVLLTKGCVDVWEPKVIRSAAGAHFRIPIHYSIDWEEMDKHLEKDSAVFIADSNANVFTEEQENKFVGYQIPVLPYYGVEYATMKHITLIIGGETEGISEESYRLAASRNGLRLNIPLEKGVDSLNTGMATAVVAFEIKKQLIQAWKRIKLEKQGVN